MAFLVEEQLEWYLELMEITVLVSSKQNFYVEFLHAHQKLMGKTTQSL